MTQPTTRRTTRAIPVGRPGRRARRVLLILAAAVTGAIVFAAPAAADVTVAPAGGTQGEAARLTFTLPNDRPAAHTVKVELQLPEAAPVGEVFPMSVDNWAPGLTMRKLTGPVELIHGTQTTEVVSLVTWTRTAGTPTPGQPDQLSISLGPLPETDRFAFTVIQTYSDGTVVRWSDTPGADGTKPAGPGPALTLVPPATQPDAAPPVAEAEPDGGVNALGAWTAAILLIGALLLAGWAFLRSDRRRPAATAEITPVRPSPAGRGREGAGRPGVARRVRRIHRIKEIHDDGRPERARPAPDDHDYRTGAGLGGRPKDRADA